jgi:large subunit ribosomal protein L29
MEQSVIKELSTAELREKITEEKANLVKLTLGHSISPIENPMKIRGARRTIARLNTELSRRMKQDSSKN